MTDIQSTIDSMSLDEIKQRLAEYMAADQQLAPRPVAVEVRLNSTNNARCRYEVLLISDDGKEQEVKFRDRYSRLVYVYTLLHPQGYQRRSAPSGSCRQLQGASPALHHALYERQPGADKDHQ